MDKKVSHLSKGLAGLWAGFPPLLIFPLAILVLSLLLVLPVYSANVPGSKGAWLYSVDVPVENQSASERRRGSRLALETVLKRVSGLAQIEQTPALKLALAESERYYLQYGFSSRTMFPGEAEEHKSTFLSVRFDPAEIAKLVKLSAMPVWSANRPSVIAWVVVERSERGAFDGANTSREILGANQSDALQAAFIEAASERGLRLVFPAMDLEDQFAVSTGVVWGQMSSEIFSASQRYGIDTLLIGRVVETALGYRAEWQFANADASLPYAEEQKEYVDLASGAVNFVTRELVQRYAVVSGTGGSLQFIVRNIASFSAYSSVLNYLNALEFVDSVQIERIRGQELLIAIETNSSWGQFSDLLALDGVLQLPERDFASNPLSGDQMHTLLWRDDTL